MFISLQQTKIPLQIYGALLDVQWFFGNAEEGSFIDCLSALSYVDTGSTL